MANFLCADNAKERFLSRKITEFHSWRMTFLVKILEGFIRIHVNFMIMIKKRKRKKTLMMLGVGDNSARLIMKRVATPS